MSYLTLSGACTVIFDRLGLPESEVVDIVWRQQLLPALQEGLLAVEGTKKEYRNDGDMAAHYSRLVTDLTVLHEWPMAQVPRDWWFTAAPVRLVGDVRSLVRDGRSGRIEAMCCLQVRQADIDRLWPASVRQQRPYEIALQIAKDLALEKKADVKAKMKEALGELYSDTIAEDAWANRLPRDQKPKGGRPKKPS